MRLLYQETKEKESAGKTLQVVPIQRILSRKIRFKEL
jgi:hypothetical protein